MKPVRGLVLRYTSSCRSWYTVVRKAWTWKYPSHCSTTDSVQEESMLLWCLYQSLLQKACAYCNLRFLFVAGRCGALWSDAAFQHEVHSEKLFGGNTWLFESLLPSCHARHIFSQRTAARLLRSLVQTVLCKPRRWLCWKVPGTSKAHLISSHAMFILMLALNSSWCLHWASVMWLADFDVCMNENKVCKWRPIIKTSSTPWGHNVKDGNRQQALWQNSESFGLND